MNRQVFELASNLLMSNSRTRVYNLVYGEQQQLKQRKAKKETNKKFTASATSLTI